MNMYEARWNNAVSIAEKVNDYLEKGFMVFDDSGQAVKMKFEITEESIHLPVSDQCKFIYFLNDREMDNGMYTKIADYNAQFKDWKIVHPKDISDLFKRN